MQARKEKKGVIKNSQTRPSKAAAQKQYVEANSAKANRAVKKSIKTDKERFIESLAKEAEEASGKLQAGRQAHQRQER